LKSADGSSTDVTDAAAWQSSNATVAVINTPASVRAVGPGQTDISAQYQGIRGSTPLSTLSPSDIAQFFFAFFCCADIPQLTMFPQTGVQLTARIVLANNITYDINDRTSFSSSNPEIVLAGGTGQILARTPGTAQISAAYQGRTAKLDVRVSP
jgi:hypothetical protein